MASLVRKDGIILDYSDVAPSPCKDFCQVVVDQKNKEVTYRWWKITPRCTENKVPPGQSRDTYEEFLEDDKTQSEIHRVFGEPFLEYVKQLVKGHIDYLPRLDDDLLVRIISYLDLEDIARLAQVSKQFHKLCISDELWHTVYARHCETAITPELEHLARDNGWRKLFFTNKLQLQVQINRQRKRKVNEMMDTDEENSGSDSPVQLRRQARKRIDDGNANNNAADDADDTFLTTEELN